MTTQKNFKANAQDNNAWEYDQIKKQERKQHKGLRLQRKTRKIVWMES